MRRWRHTRTTLTGAISFALALALCGCNTSNTEPPTAPGGALVVESFQTATQPSASGLRVQLRFRVLEGLADLIQAAQTGTANSRVCHSGSCIEGQLSTVFSERDCMSVAKTPVANTALGFAATWLDDGIVGIDFCIDPVAEQTEFETTVSDGRRRSNVIQTVCTPEGACFSS